MSPGFALLEYFKTTWAVLKQTNSSERSEQRGEQVSESDKQRQRNCPPELRK